MTKKNFFLLILATSSISLSACSRLPQKYQVIHNSTNDYQRAVTLPPITIPPGYSSSQFKEKYVVPNPQLAGSKTPVDLTPPKIDANANNGETF